MRPPRVAKLHWTRAHLDEIEVLSDRAARVHVDVGAIKKLPNEWNEALKCITKLLAMQKLALLGTF